MSAKRAIVFITGNKNKLSEVQAIVGKEIQIDHKKLDLPEYQGEPEDIATLKCEEAARECPGQTVLVEDTSLCFNAYHGLPGPYIKWFLDKMGRSGLCKMLNGFDDRTAVAQCIFAYKEPNSKVELIKGECLGSIGLDPKFTPGTEPFGWDPCFIPSKRSNGEDNSETFAEMDKDEKNKISHRANALNKLKQYLNNKRKLV